LRETIFTLEATPIKFGPGAVDDAGWEAARLGVSRALLVSDPGIPHVERVASSLRESGISVVVYAESRVEPTLDSLQAAAAFALDAGVDGFVGRRRLVDRHGEGREPDRLAPGAGDGVCERAGG